MKQLMFGLGIISLIFIHPYIGCVCLAVAWRIDDKDEEVTEIELTLMEDMSRSNDLYERMY